MTAPQYRSQCYDLFGSLGRTRTCNRVVNSDPLYLRATREYNKLKKSPCDGEWVSYYIQSIEEAPPSICAEATTEFMGVLTFPLILVDALHRVTVEKCNTVVLGPKAFTVRSNSRVGSEHVMKRIVISISVPDLNTETAQEATKGASGGASVGAIMTVSISESLGNSESNFASITRLDDPQAASRVAMRICFCI